MLFRPYGVLRSEDQLPLLRDSQTVFAPVVLDDELAITILTT